MLTQRKRFNYLSSYQRALNSQSKTGQIQFNGLKPGSIGNSGSKTENSQNYSAKEPVSLHDQISKHQTSASITKKNVLKQKPGTSNIVNKNQNIHKQNQSKQERLTRRISQLQEENRNLLKSTAQKFQGLQSHLEKVQALLKNKENTIFSLQKDKENLEEQKKQLLEIIHSKNQNTKQLEQSLSELRYKLASMEKQNQQNKIKFVETGTQSDIIQQENEKQVIQSEKVVCDCVCQVGNQISLRVDQCSQTESLDYPVDPHTKPNYKEKYEKLFTKALEMEDQIYKLKEQLFDSQSQCKSLQQQFNTYKILYQIQKVSQQTNIFLKE